MRDRIGNPNNVLIVKPSTATDSSLQQSDVKPLAGEQTTTKQSKTNVNMSIPVKSTNKQVEDLKNKIESPDHDRNGSAARTTLDKPLQDSVAPLFPHEAGGTEAGLDPGVRAQIEQVFPASTTREVAITKEHHRAASSSIIPQEPSADDLADPSLEPFPEGRDNILTRIQTLKQELPVDGAYVGEKFSAEDLPAGAHMGKRNSSSADACGNSIPALIVEDLDESCKLSLCHLALI